MTMIDKLDEFLKREEQNIKNDLATLVSIPSMAVYSDMSAPFGRDCARAVDAALSIADKHGLITDNIDYKCCSASLVSDKSEDEIGIICHLDVVPAGDGWLYEPFQLTVKDNLYIGRGTRDDKGAAIAAMYALKFLKEHNIDLPFSVKLIMGSDEETRMTDLEHFLNNRKPPRFSFTPDSEYPVCVGEKGIAGCEIRLCRMGGKLLEIKGGNADNSVCDYVTATVRTNVKLHKENNIDIAADDDGICKIIASGNTSHAAYPENSLNAIFVLAEYLIKNSAFPANSYEYKVFDFLQKVLKYYDGSGLNIKMEDQESGYLTCIGGRIYEKDGYAVLNINIRYPVTASFESVFPKISKTCTNYGFEASMIYNKPPFYFNPDNENIKALTKAYTQITGDIRTTYTTGGGTYARACPNTVAFGISYKDTKGLLGERRGDVHERDEYITVRELHDTVKIIALSLCNLAELQH